MLDICTWTLSFIIFSDLVPDLYFQDTDTWDSCDMHYTDYVMFLDLPWCFILWSHVLVIILHDNYLSRIFHVHYMHVTPYMCWHLKKTRFLLAWTMSKLVDIYKRQVTDKLTTSLHPSLRDKEATWTLLIQQADSEPGLSLNRPQQV